MEKMELSTAVKKTIGQFKKYKLKTAIKNIFYHFLTRERKACFGLENPNETIYIIRSLAEKSPFYIGPVHNLLANYFYVLSHICYAREKGWIPVVDQLNYPVYNSHETPINSTRNPWEYFWEQPGGVSLEDAYRSKNVVLSKQSWFWEWDMGYDVGKYTDEKTVAFYRELASEVKLNRVIVAHIKDILDNLFPENKKILGLNVRLGSYARNSQEQHEGHPIHPELEELVLILRDYVKDWEADYIFVASDTEYALEYLKKEFGNKLLVYPRLRAAMGTEYAPDPQKNIYAPGRAYQTALDYLTEMELLTRCCGLIGSVTSGFRYALVHSHCGRERIVVIDKGIFEDGRKKNGQ